MKNYILIFVFLMTISFAFSQQETNSKLTHQATPDELANKHLIGKNFQETDPPVGEVRNIAEWESMEAVLISYTGEFGIPYSLIQDMSENNTVTTIVSGTTQENTIRGYYTSNNVNIDNCNFLHAPVNSYWTRDFSPWFIAVDNSEVSIVNFPYNRPRPDDNDIPIEMATFLDVPLYGMNVVQTGGNYMTDGMGISGSTPIVYTESAESGVSQSEVDERMLSYLGIHTYHVVDDPMDDYIDHIDCWGKFLDVDKILITEVPESDYRYDDYEATAAYFAEQNCSYGYPYQVHRVQAATYNDYDVNPYTNALILNNQVFVPQTGSSYDNDAIALYEELMPGYEIIGVYSNSWINSDALHCRTHGVADRNMLYINHIPLYGTIDSYNGYLLEAEIYSYAGNDLLTDFPKLHYKVDNGEYKELIMTGLETKTNTYQVVIPEQTEGSEISYYIEAEDISSKHETHPQIGIYDPHIFTASSSSPAIVKENTEQDNFNIYPNPSIGHFFIWLDYEKNTEIDININSITGKNIYNEKTFVESNLHKIDIPISQGVYILTIKTNKNTISKKLIIK